MNVGKKFENNFKESIPKNIFCYRPPDAAQAFGGSDKLRFSRHSLCDYMLFDGTVLYCLELKSVQGNSISFERDKTEKGLIHFYQIEALEEVNSYNNVLGGFVLDFRQSDTTYYISIDEFIKLINTIDKKSINVNDINTLCSPIIVDKRKMRVNYRYDIEKLLEKIKEVSYG